MVFVELLDEDLNGGGYLKNENIVEFCYYEILRFLHLSKKTQCAWIRLLF